MKSTGQDFLRKFAQKYWRKSKFAQKFLKIWVEKIFVALRIELFGQLKFLFSKKIPAY